MGHTREIQLNASAQINFANIAALGNGVLQSLNEVREEEPVAWNESVNGWLVTRHADVMDGFLDKFPLSCVRMEARSAGTAEAAAMAERYPLMTASIPFWIVNADPPLHTRLRRLMARGIIAAVLDGIEGRPEIEFLEDVSRQITGRVILNIFGLPDTVLPRLKEWSVAFNVGFGGVQAPSIEVMDRVERCMAEMLQVFRPAVAQRRLAPADDFLSLLVRASDGDDQLSEAELLGICYLVIVAGHDTTMNTMTLGVAALSQNAGARAQLLEAPERILESVLEIMRYVAMSTAFTRIAKQDFEWHGKAIKGGDSIWLMPAAANRDPRVFADPEVLDLRRDNNDQMTVFGAGIHHCIGHLLAKMQLCEFFPEFFRRFPDAAILDEDLRFIPALTFRGLSGLPMRLR
jgi:pimeloyl-[acyl-carrier protein] synthase